jgi:plasmid stability protein
MKNRKTALIEYQSDITLVSMNLLIRNIPVETHQKLRERAKINHRSLNQEIVSLLVAFSSQETEAERIQKRREYLQQVLDRIDLRRAKMTSFPTSEEMDQARKEGRVE